jgi:hypothetical protein
LKKQRTIKFKRGAKNKPLKLDKSSIGQPMNFKHVQHAGFDPKRGFVHDGIVDVKYLNLFEEGGISKKLLDDKETREFVYK